jgi:spore maturation protein SpmA
MLNAVWSFLLLCGLIVGAFMGTLKPTMDAVFTVCQDVVMTIALPLAGKIMLWLGVLRVMEKAGLMELIARALAPLLRFLFPEVPATHPAMGAMTMNISANLLGLGNSATPMGLKAMEHLQELNPQKHTATNAMCMFLALNTAGLTLIPFTAITFLSNGGMKNPYGIIFPTIASTGCAAMIAVLTAKLLQGMPMFRVSRKDDDVDAPDATGKKRPFHLTTLRLGVLIAVAAAFAAGVLLQFAPAAQDSFLEKTGLKTVMQQEAAKKQAAQQHAAEKAPPKELTWIDKISATAIPFVLLATVLVGLARGVPIYEAAVEGAKEGFEIALRIMPFLVIMLSGITVFRASGALILVEHGLRPLLDWIHLPVELLPMAIMRPLSGSGSSGLLNEMILRPEVSDFLKYTAAIMYGSTETTFYVLAVYFGSVGVTRIRHALAVGIVADIVGMTCAIALGWMLFGKG